MQWNLLDGLIAAATADEADVRLARDEWAGLSGRVHSDHELYGERSDAFVEWYLLERARAEGRTPIEIHLAEAGPSLDGPQRTFALALSRSYRSLFQVRRLRGGGLLVDDLIGGGVFDVEERRRLPGVAVADVFEARLVPDLDVPYRVFFSRTMLFHPRDATGAVLDEVAAARLNGEPGPRILFRLQRQRLRCLAYKHVPAARIYAQRDAPP
jgi:hypothetical protein